MKYKLGFLGAGNMAEAIAKAAVEKKIIKPSKIIASDPSHSRRDVFEAMGIAVVDDNAAVLAESEYVLLAIKPQMLSDIALELSELKPEQILISIMAGISTEKLAQVVAEKSSSDLSPRIVRVMPNTPMMVGVGMAAVCVGQHAQRGDQDLAMKLFSSAGDAIEVEEDMLDAVTAVSGSGPAYLFYLAEAMTAAAVKLGMAEHGGRLVRQTLLGAATLLDRSADTPAELRKKVTSPGGTTEAAINTMESKQVRDAIIEAVVAAEARSKELGK